MKNVLNSFNRAINEIGKKFVKDFRTELEQQNSVATGNLSDTMHYDLVEDGDSVELIIKTRADYVQAVNEGSKPFFPNITAIKKWMDAKGVGYSDENEKELIAYNIAKKISRDGLPSKEGLARSKNGRKTRFIDSVVESKKSGRNKSIHKAIGQDIDNIFKQLPKQI
tara:strand:- start:542 stop:1042 length:501 start_codon:yes stop_codon:yes gene_type:complete